MTHAFRKAWHDVLSPLLRRPKQLQVAALCYAPDEDSKKILLITSRDTGRWVLPKGWPIEGKSGPQAAAQEAWEEAGVRPAEIGQQAIGQFTYDKRLDNGASCPVVALVYPIKVDRLADCFPEAAERRRSWVSPAEAADMVQERDLQALLTQI